MELFAYFGLEFSIDMLFIVNLILTVGECTFVSEFAVSGGREVLAELSFVLHLVTLDEVLAFFLISEFSFRRFRRVVTAGGGIRGAAVLSELGERGNGHC